MHKLQKLWFENMQNQTVSAEHVKSQMAEIS